MKKLNEVVLVPFTICTDVFELLLGGGVDPLELLLELLQLVHGGFGN
jgi:hypothetical protein